MVQNQDNDIYKPHRSAQSSATVNVVAKHNRNIAVKASNHHQQTKNQLSLVIIQLAYFIAMYFAVIRRQK